LSVSNRTKGAVDNWKLIFFGIIVKNSQHS